MKKIITRSLLAIVMGIGAMLMYAAWVFSPFFPLLTMMLQKQNILITLHNNAEIRPTLGFLTGFFILQYTENGYTLSFADSYAVNPPVSPLIAPEILQKRFGATLEWKGWTFRDSNMDLWFPENAKNAIELLSLDPQFASISIQNVIAIDMYSVEKIIDTLGGVWHKGQKVDGKSFFSLLESESKDFVPTTTKEWLERKSGLSDFGKQIIKSAVLQPWKWNVLSKTTTHLLQQKHILIFSVNPVLQNIWESKQWAGHNSIENNEIPWGINIANIGGKKSDRYIQKNINSTISINENGEIKEIIRIQCIHNGTRNLHSDRYFAYVRLIKPKGTQIISSSGDFEYAPKNESDNTISFFFWMDESSEKNFTITLQYPKTIEASFITPLLWHFFPQPGETNTNASITFQGVGDTSFASKYKNMQHTENISTLSIPEEEMTIDIQWQEDTTAPMLEEMLWKEERKVLRVQFSENIQPISKDTIITTLGEKSYEIQEIKKENRAIEIVYTQKIPFSDTQKYRIHISNVSDIFGNKKNINWSIR